MSVKETNYLRGRRKEYKVCKQLREEGFDLVQRSAGSHSPVDVFAINTKTKCILLVQAKPNSFSHKKILKLLEENKELNGAYDVGFEVR